MNARSRLESHRDELATAIAVSALLIGTATGSAWTMLLLGVAALLLTSVLYWRRIGTNCLFAVVTAAVVGSIAALSLIRL